MTADIHALSFCPHELVNLKKVPAVFPLALLHLPHNRLLSLLSLSGPPNCPIPVMSATPLPISNPRTLVTISSDGELAAPPTGQGDRKTVCAVAFIGATRAGKSTLINALLGTEDARVAQPDQDGATTAGIRAFDWRWQQPPPKPKRLGHAHQQHECAPESSFYSSIRLSVVPFGEAKTQTDSTRLRELVQAEQAKATYSAPIRKALLLDTEGTDAALFIPPAEAHPARGGENPHLKKAAAHKCRNTTVERQLPRLAFIASNVLVVVTTKDRSELLFML